MVALNLLVLWVGALGSYPTRASTLYTEMHILFVVSFCLQAKHCTAAALKRRVLQVSDSLSGDM